MANSSAGSRTAAPFQAFFVWAGWFFQLTAGGTFLTLRAYLGVLPARSPGLWITQNVLTSLAAIFALIAVLLVFHVLPNL